MQKIPFVRDQNDVEHIAGITSSFPYVMHCRNLTDDVIPWHWHEEVEFNYAYQGTIEVQTYDRTYVIRQGEAYFINTNVMDKKKKDPNSSITIEHAHLFNPVLLGGHFNSVFTTKYLNPILNDRSIEVLIIRKTTPSGKQFIQLLHKLTDLDEQENQEFQIRNVLSQAWLVLQQEIEIQRREHRINDGPRERAQNILSYLQHRYTEKITITDIAKYVNVSSKECIRSFKHVFQQTPIEYLMSYRIEQAKKQLKNTKDPITLIAFQTGFNTGAYFSKVFKERVGITPKKYRNNYLNH